MIGIQNPWGMPESQVPDNLGLSLKKHLDPRRRLRRHLKFAKKGLRFAKSTADPRQHLRFAKRGLDPAGLFKKKRHGRHKGIFAAMERIRKRRSILPGAGTPAVTMAVSSPEATVALGDLGFKFPKIGRKLRKKIFKYAAIGAATYFTGGAALALLKAKPGLVGGLLKKGVKAVAPIAKTVIQARVVPVQPDSVTATAGAAGIPTGGAPGQELSPTYGQVPGGAFQNYSPQSYAGGGYTPLPSNYDPEAGEITGGISSQPGVQQAGFGGISPTVLLVGAGLAAYMLLGRRR